ncbi:MAG: endonuclease domain-containing protein [Proteobacteria bacterium]|nr:endonuclease domain-containing protein [Pseudomonadota bacterium]
MAKDTERARALRRDSSLPEKKFWELIRAHRLEGFKFRRQHQIGPFFADFACVSRKLVFEIDGRHHDNQIEADGRRTALMERMGWRVIQFSASEVLANPDGIWSAVYAALMPCTAPSPSLSP